MAEYVPGREFALRLDAADALASRRELFYIRPGQIYMDGNSLGLCSKGAERAVLRALEDWKKYGIGIWTGAETDYFLYYESIGAKLARLINARPEEVTVCASTTLNIHQCVATFWKPDARRYKIVVDELNFPTDRYAVTSQIAQRGLEPDEVLKVVPSRDGKTLAMEDILAALTEDVSLVLLPSVLYRSAQLLDMAAITRAAHERGIICGFDLCHSIGAVDHDMEAVDCDFAVWCNYKYLSGGPGATAGLYVNRRHFERGPGLAGWWGNRNDTQFELRPEFEHAMNAGGWQTGTSPILSMAAVDGALDAYEGLTMAQVRAVPPAELAGSPVERIVDLSHGSEDLPPTDGIAWYTQAGDRVVIRPSGTEPKVKCYLEVIEPSATDLAEAKERAHMRLEAFKADVSAALTLK